MFEKTQPARVIGIVLSDGRVMKVRAIRKDDGKVYSILPIVLGRLDEQTRDQIIEALEEDNSRRFNKNGID